MATKLTERQREIRSAERAQRRLNVSQVQSQATIERNRSQELGERERVRRQYQIKTESQIASQRRNRNIVSGIAGGAVGATQTATKPATNLFLVVLFTMFGLIVFYNLVAHPTSTSGFLGGLGNWLSTISTTTPLFTSKATS